MTYFSSTTFVELGDIFHNSTIGNSCRKLPIGNAHKDMSITNLRIIRDTLNSRYIQRGIFVLICMGMEDNTNMDTKRYLWIGYLFKEIGRFYLWIGDY